MIMKTIENEALKAFMLEHFDYDGLKKAGFYGEIKRTDYEGQAKRICHFFSLSSVFEWLTLQRPNCHISLMPSTIKCPMCTCEQTIPDKDKGQFTFKCIDCKRHLVATFTMNGCYVTEKRGFKETTDAYLREDEKSFIYKP